jgi:AraC-like DNA-binding protein
VATLSSTIQRGHLRLIPPPSRPRVLLADGDLGRRVTLHVALSTRHASVTAATPSEAFERATRDRFDVAVLDAAMLNGALPRVVGLLRGAAPRVRLLVTMGRRDLRARRQAETLGVDAVLARPVAAQRLLDRVDALGAPGDATAPMERTVGRAIDLMARDVSHLLDLRALAAAVGLALPRLDTAFRANTGLSLHDYVHGVRLLVARRLLEDTDLDVETLVELLGFTDAGELSALV